ncbi:hypothetical protein JD969_08615 [Planctomycetota bacterium]|nr:hypothetical protein JD969_08615 [Planctomycetota bacterium]
MMIVLMVVGAINVHAEDGDNPVTNVLKKLRQVDEKVENVAGFKEGVWMTQAMMKEDCDFLVKTIEEVHVKPWAYIGEEEYAQLKDVMYKAVDEAGEGMPVDDFFVVCSRYTSGLLNDHLGLLAKKGWWWRINNGMIFQMGLSVSDGKVLFWDYEGDAELPRGLEVVKIGEKDADTFMKELAYWCPREGRREGNLRRLRKTYVMSFWLTKEFAGEDYIPLVLKDKNGEEREYRLPAVNCVGWNMKQSKGSGKQNNEGPIHFRVLDEFDGERTGLMVIDGFESKLKFERQTVNAFMKMKAEGVKHLIVDLRKNRGGNSGLGDMVINYLADKPWKVIDRITLRVSEQSLAQRPHLYRYRNHLGKLVRYTCSTNYPKKNLMNRFEGEVYVLANEGTASAGMDFCVPIKHYGIGTLIGEETSGALKCYIDNIYFTLPQSGLRGYVAYKYNEYVGDDVQFGQGVLPDYEVKQSLESDKAGRDDVMEFTLDLIRKRGEGSE